MVALITLSTMSVASSQDAATPGPQPFFVLPDTSDKPSAPATVANRLPSIQTSLGRYGDPGGLRAFLSSKGIDYAFTDIAEVLGNTSGGVKRGATFESRLDARLDVDLDRLAGWHGALLHANAYQIDGRGLSGNNTLDLFIVSGIEAYPSTRLYEAWFEQDLAAGQADAGKVFVRLGQLAADREFFVSQTATLFFNSTFGWPASFNNDLPSGGPSFPLATPGLRLKVLPDDHLAFLAAVFDGDAAGPYRPGYNSPLPQVRDPAGTAFRLDDAPFFITEAAYTYNKDGDPKTLPGTVKVGFLQHFGTFAPENPSVSGFTSVRGNDSFYAVIDQTFYRPPNVGADREGAAFFLRVSSSPSDRNLVDLYLDGGVSYKGLFPGRPDDTTGIAAAYAHVSPEATQADIATGTPLVRDYQAVIEGTHQFTVLPGLSVQLDAQYIVHPGSTGVADPATGPPTRNALVLAYGPPSATEPPTTCADAPDPGRPRFDHREGGA